MMLNNIRLLDALYDYHKLVSDFSILLHDIEPIFKKIVIMEGFRSKVYKCPAGYYTIGCGLNVDARLREEVEKDIKNPKIDYDKVDYTKLLKYFPHFKEDNKKVSKDDAVKAVKRYCIDEILFKLPLLIKEDNIDLNHHYLRALCSLLYNIGNTAFAKSRMLQAIKKNDWETAKKECDWNLNDLKNPGLHDRRIFEMILIQRGIEYEKK